MIQLQTGVRVLVMGLNRPKTIECPEIIEENPL